MPYFDSDGVKIHFEETGSGDPVVLVHGFAASIKGNWDGPGWISFLARNYRVIALDCRGHGSSDKPHDREAYGMEKMGADVIRLIDHLGIRRTLLMGYSMGARISLYLLATYPERWRAVVLGGIGGGLATEAMTERAPKIVNALLADDPKSVTDPTGKQFRVFAEQNRNDLEALAACMGAGRTPPDKARIAAVKLPVMLVIGTNDTLVGSAESLRDAIPGSTLVKIEGRDHLSTVGDKRYFQAVADFFAKAPA